MGTHSVADAKNRLPELIDRALKGEGVVITRHGKPVVELKPIPEPAHPVSPADLDWLAAHPIGRGLGKGRGPRPLRKKKGEGGRGGASLAPPAFFLRCRKNTTTPPP